MLIFRKDVPSPGIAGSCSGEDIGVETAKTTGELTVNNIYLTINVAACKCGETEEMVRLLKTTTSKEKLINIVENFNYKG